ncbi:MAG TPA: hypothetical protein PLB12_06450 [Candidatus Goldiibacteriota bacterium]|nr:hypothetical protein [Candidatus Goldiibacteriota bacterium]HRQ43979.1 hypothetical protein [Candidatus Goldiibacteriota bacterium]
MKKIMMVFMLLAAIIPFAAAETADYSSIAATATAVTAALQNMSATAVITPEATAVQAATPAPSPIPTAAPTKTRNMFDDLGDFLGVKKDPLQVQAEAAAEAAKEAETAAKNRENEMSLAGKLLITADVFGAATTAFTWLGYSSMLSDYNDIYAIKDNTTLENYEMLKRMSKSVDDKLTTAVVVTGITSALLIYTAVDAIWLHLAFPVNVKAAYYDNNPGVLLTYNY